MKFIRDLKKISLTEAEKGEARNALLRHMGRYPAENYSPSNNLSLVSLLFKNKMVIAAASFVLALGVGGGVSYAAEFAVPGDILYPVKIHINEKMLAAVSITPKQKIVWEEKRVERRLEEAEKLSARGQLGKKKLEINNRILKKLEQRSKKEKKDNAILEEILQTKITAPPSVIEANTTVEKIYRKEKAEIKAEDKEEAGINLHLRVTSSLELKPSHLDFKNNEKQDKNR